MKTRGSWLVQNVSAGTIAFGVVVVALGVVAFHVSDGMRVPSNDHLPGYALDDQEMFKLERAGVLFIGGLLAVTIIGQALALALPMKISFKFGSVEVAVDQVAQASLDVAAGTKHLDDRLKQATQVIDDIRAGQAATDKNLAACVSTILELADQLEEVQAGLPKPPGTATMGDESG